MAYNFLAEKSGGDLQAIHRSIEQYDLFEFFPVEVTAEAVVLGISIPFKSLDSPQFQPELVKMMTQLTVTEGFRVIDLYTGKPVTASEIPDLAKQISA